MYNFSNIKTKSPSKRPFINLSIFFNYINLSNVYMTHGALDPWNPMGHGVEQGATLIANASHCADFGSIKSTDSEEMRASKEKLAGLVRQWLA
ncbi:uncharacterized protein Dyak_GE25602 [Drosophila yakuba]|uniref:Uncharacterized protein n=1 Tax=Drosophila yakuba TaxID=7245 RepID=B4PNG3_DROYA|nr:uncharacterized protein Dyak_GE25602 [Drosophila yakuba]